MRARSKTIFHLLFACTTLLLLTGCGYHMHTMGKPIGIEIKSMAIPMVKSPSAFLGFEPVFTTAIRREFISHAKIPLVSEKNAAMVLIVNVRKIWTEPLTYRITKTKVSGNNTYYEVTNSRWIRAKIKARLVNRTTGKVVWEDNSINERTTYALTSNPPDPILDRYNKKEAVRRIAEQIAKRLYLKTMERF
ncbi:MAG: hypothetical protein B1H11_03645 [Desulfobacteraceae bacterium 4484_190.1]|nr:MAG: hypothetical protein B1H11_03645 [Desulfobacteraceae bacterium 4484_190.1]